MRYRILFGFISLTFSSLVNASAGTEYYLGGGTILGALGWLFFFGGIAAVSAFIDKFFGSNNKDNDEE